VLLGTVLAAASALPLAGPQLLRAFIDTAIAGGAVWTLVVIAGAYALLGITAQGTTVATTYAANQVAWSATNALREQAARHVLDLDLAFHRHASPGTLIERVDGDATAIAKFFTDFAVKVIGAGLMLGGVVVLVSLEDWRIGAAFALYAAVSVAVILRLRDIAVPATTAERAAYADVLGVVEERIAGAEDVRALGGGTHAVGRLVEASAGLLRRSVAAWTRQGSIWGIANLMLGAGALGMLLGGALLQRRGVITVGTVFLLFQYVQVLQRPVHQLSDQLQEVQRAAAGAARIADLLEQRPRLEQAGQASLPVGPLTVRFDRLGFAYPDDDVPVLHGVDLEVPAGTVVGLVGRTGSGKSTLARLALRLADPTVGRVLVGGVDLREVSPASLRERVAIVTQEVQLFRATVRENLTLFGAVRATEADLADVVATVGLGGWLAEQASGLDTVLGAGGSGLSAGQAQLLGLARVFLRDPGLVVLDEASSRVDPVTQRLVEDATDRLLVNRTGIVIAHRLSAVLRADQVVVLDHGRVVEHGATQRLAADPSSHLGRLLALEAEEEVTA
jgi:ATP-binding cassette, subfamily B, bacterial